MQHDCCVKSLGAAALRRIKAFSKSGASGCFPGFFFLSRDDDIMESQRNVTSSASLLRKGTQPQAPYLKSFVLAIRWKKKHPPIPVVY